MLDPKVIERVLDKRSVRGASDESLITWLESLKAGAWKGQPRTIDGFIDAIKLTPLNKQGEIK